MADIFYNCMYGETYARFINEAVKRSDIISIELHWYSEKYSFHDKKECIEKGFFSEEQYDSFYNAFKKTWQANKTVFENRTLPYLKRLEPFLIEGQCFESKNVNYYLYSSPSIVPFLLEPGSISTWGDPFFPNDLTFINNDETWFFCENHELSASLFPDSQDDYNFWKNMGIVFCDEFNYERDVERRPIAEYLLNR